jgi:carbonic anhydrase
LFSLRFVYRFWRADREDRIETRENRLHYFNEPPTSWKVLFNLVCRDAVRTLDVGRTSRTLAVATSNMARDSADVQAGEALNRLLDGNRRFVAGDLNQLTGPALVQRRYALAKEQKPFAVIVGCSDSRVPPELVFDVTLGEIFVVRTAGEVVETNALGSIEFAIELLGTRLIVVLGHQDCGAVSAAVSRVTQTGEIPNVLKAIQLAVKEAKKQPGDSVESAVRANARNIATRLQSTGPIIPPRVQSGEVKVVAAYYSLDSGQVELLN